MSVGITKRQAESVDFIREYAAANNGVPPSYDEIRTKMGTKSKSDVARLIDGLEERGRITRIPRRARTIRITDDTSLRPDVMDRLPLYAAREDTTPDEVVSRCLNALEKKDHR